jgi:hypothetical protein
MTRVRSVVSLLVALASVGVHADPSCLQSFKVRGDRSVSGFSWLPGSRGLPAKPISCRSLELSRQAYFVANDKMIDVVMLTHAQRWQTEVERSLARLDRAQQELSAKSAQDATLDALRVSYRVLKYEFGKASALVGCFAPEPTASKALCAIGLVILAEDTASVVDGSIAKTEMSEGAKKLSSHVAQLKAQYAKLKQQSGKFNMSVAQEQHSRVLVGMCQAVKSSCL